jgi:ribosome-binding factor A
MKTRRQRQSVDSKFVELKHTEYQDEDAAAISKFFRKSTAEHLPPRKTLQLARQIAETLNSVLSGECRDTLLQSLFVESVVPAPDAAQMLVTVQPLDPDSAATEAEILSRLQGAMSWLRAEVAASITRKRAPNLVFQVHPAGGPI